MKYLMRSKLFVPASRPALFEKALASDADAICFDLEDSVLPSQKAEARENLREFFSRGPQMKKMVTVRVNAVTSGAFAEDLRVAVAEVVAAVAIPKVDDPSEICEAAAALTKLERERGLQTTMQILPTIESSRGLRLAREIAESDARVAGLQLGLADLFGSLGIRQDDAVAAQQVRFRLRLAAGEASVPCFDSAYTDFRNEEGFAREAMAARSLGFQGTSCIHPSQIAAANGIFSPREDEIAEARRIIEAARQAGAGAFALDGRMVDAPFVKRAEEVLHLQECIEAQKR